MPDKSRRGRGKHPHKSKKSRARRHGAMPLPQPLVTDTSQPVATISTPPSSGAPASTTKSRKIQYPYITTELRVIGILAGAIIVILIVLAQVLS